MSGSASDYKRSLSAQGPTLLLKRVADKCDEIAGCRGECQTCTVVHESLKGWSQAHEGTAVFARDGGGQPGGLKDCMPVVDLDRRS